MILSVLKIFLPSITAFIVGILITPLISGFLYKHKLWKKTSVQKTLDGREASISKMLHNDEERKTPRMGGMVVWLSALLTILIFWFVSKIFQNETTEKLEFLSRSQTWLPLFTFLSASFIGLIDDYFVVSEKGKYIGGPWIRVK